MMKDLQEGATHFDPKAEEEARTLERITAMLPEETLDYLFDQEGNEIAEIDHDRYKNDLIALLPQIIAEVEKHVTDRPIGVSQWEAMGHKYGYWDYFLAEAQKAKVEEIRKIINIELNDKFYTYLGERLKKEGAIEEGFEIALLTILSNLK